MTSFHYRLLWFLSAFPILVQIALGVRFFEFLHLLKEFDVPSFTIVFISLPVLEYSFLLFPFYVLSLFLLLWSEKRQKLCVILSFCLIISFVIRFIGIYYFKVWNYPIPLFMEYGGQIFGIILILVLLRILFIENSIFEKYSSFAQQNLMSRFYKVIVALCYFITFSFLIIGALYDEQYFVYELPFIVYLLYEAKIYLKTNKWVSAFFVLFFILCVSLHITRFYNSFAYPRVNKIYTLNNDVEIFQDSNCSYGNSVHNRPQTRENYKSYILKEGVPFRIEQSHVTMRRRGCSASYTLLILDELYKKSFQACSKENYITVQGDLLFLSSSWLKTKEPSVRYNLRRYLETKFYDIFLLGFIILVVLRKIIQKIRRI